MAFAVLAAPLAVAAPPDVIRTGGPSARADAKHAVVLSSRSLTGRPFTVTNAAGRVVLRGRLRRARGAALPWRHAAVADLSAVRRPGSYRVRAAGIPGVRPWVVSDAAAGQAVRAVLRFFAINADGTESSPAHGPSHLNDATLPGVGRVDLTGGWMDAGDTLKFTGTTAYGVVALLLAARLDPANAVALRSAAQTGVRWLLKARPAPGVFVAQVGDIFADHDRDPVVGYDPAADDRSPVPALATRSALLGVGYDTGGRTAAALALAAQVERDPARRALLLGEARTWYAA
ncbi:MAG: endoglucanase, partial [Solirubrobacteraceae bacterium]|nr:endoglucanase [Solirubrobacteraceae bacterium]